MNSKPIGISCLGRSIAWVLSIVLFLCLVFTLLSFSLQSVVLKPDTYIKSLEDQKFYSRIPEVVIGLVSKDLAPQDPSQMASAMIMDALMKSFIEQAIPQDWAKAQTVQIIESIMDFLNLKTNVLTLNVDLVPIKNRVTPDFTREFVNKLLSGLPACSSDQLGQLQGMFLGLPQGNNAITLCNPPAEYITLASSFLYAQISGTISALPDSMPILENTNANSIESNRSNPYFNYYVIARRAMQFLPVIDLLLIGILVALLWRDPRLNFRNLGSIFLFSGLTYGILTYFAFRSLPGWINSNVIGRFKIPGGIDLDQMFNLVINDISAEFFKISWAGAGAVALLGLVFLFISRLVNPKKDVYLHR